MQRKAYVPGIAVLLAALLVSCTGSSGSSGGSADDSKGSDTSTTAPAAQPGKYRTLPEACGAVGHDSLDSMLPGIKQIADADTRDKAYDGEATLTYDTDRRDGCRWKVESTSATDHLLIDFQRVVSYDNAVSDANKAEEIYGGEETTADLPEPADSSSGSTASTDTATPSSPSSSASPSSSPSSSSSATASPTETPADLQPRTLDGLGDEAFLNDKLSSASSAAQQRTVTVVFRTSNVIVTIEYAEQPTASTDAPDSKEMQDRARKLAQKLADTLNG